jgi:YD repeat-containing protein
MARFGHAASAVAILVAMSASAQAQVQTIYTYDVHGRLVGSDRTGTTTEYNYDKAGNRSRYKLVASGANHPPTASNLTASATAGGSQVNIPILSSLTDVDGDTLTLSIGTPTVPQGTATLASDGKSINYSAGSGVAAGDYYIYYTVSDGHASASANIKVTVSAVSNPGGGDSEIIPTAFTASSSYSSFGYTGLTTANGMRDGQFLANNTIHGTNSEADAWIKADLGAVKTVTSIKVAPANAAAAGSWGASYLSGATVQYSTDNASWTTSTTISGAVEGAYSTVNMGGVSARYVRVRKLNDYVGVGDFMVFGSGGTTPPPTGSPPVASTSYATVAYNSASNVIPLNISGTYNSVAYVTGSSHGSVQAVGSQMYYTPFTNYSGSDSFTFTATNTYGTSNVATGNITVTAPAAVPNANAVSTTVAANSSSNVVPISFSGATPTTVRVQSSVGHGTATVSNNTIYYTPTAGYSGPDSFYYDGGNAAGYGTMALASITVTAPPPPNTPPVANEDDIYTPTLFQSTSVTIQPTLNDTDADGHSLNVIWVGSLSFAYAKINGVDYDGTTGYPFSLGTLSVSGNTLTYTAPYLSNAYGSHLVVVVYYTISDGHGGTATAPVVIPVYSQP